MTLQEKVLNWVFNSNTGLSSETMAAIACGMTSKKYGFSRPHDNGDFGRCFNLVNEIPEIKLHFGKIKELCPEFGPIIDSWDRLCELYSLDEKEYEENGRSEARCFYAIKDLDDECYLAGGWFKVKGGWTKDKNHPNRID
jgi:hypothetical protein